MSKGYAPKQSTKQRQEEVKAFTPLNTLHAKLLIEIQDMEEPDWPRPTVTSTSKMDKGKYCHFHKDHGHDIENCIHLKEEIKCLLRRGFLTKYVKLN